jgi:hypothetical protein
VALALLAFAVEPIARRLRLSHLQAWGAEAQ